MGLYSGGAFYGIMPNTFATFSLISDFRICYMKLNGTRLDVTCKEKKNVKCLINKCGKVNKHVYV